MASSLATCSSYSSFSCCFPLAVDLLFVDLLTGTPLVSPRHTGDGQHGVCPAMPGLEELESRR